MKRRKRVAKRRVRCFSEAENNHLEKSLGPGYFLLIQSTGFVYMYGLQFVADTLEKKSKSKVELKNINKSSQIH